MKTALSVPILKVLFFDRLKSHRDINLDDIELFKQDLDEYTRGIDKSSLLEFTAKLEDQIERYSDKKSLSNLSDTAYTACQHLWKLINHAV